MYPVAALCLFLGTATSLAALIGLRALHLYETRTPVIIGISAATLIAYIHLFCITFFCLFLIPHATWDKFTAPYQIVFILSMPAFLVLYAGVWLLFVLGVVLRRTNSGRS